MTEMEFKRIKEKIKNAETKAAEANGKMQVIKEQWKEKYGFDDLDSAKEKLEEIKKDAETKTEKRNEMMEKLESSFDWNSVF